MFFLLSFPRETELLLVSETPFPDQGHPSPARTGAGAAWALGCALGVRARTAGRPQVAAGWADLPPGGGGGWTGRIDREAGRVPAGLGGEAGLSRTGPHPEGPFHATLRPSRLDTWGTNKGSAFPKVRARQGCTFQLGEDTPHSQAPTVCLGPETPWGVTAWGGARPSQDRCAPRLAQLGGSQEPSAHI